VVFIYPVYNIIGGMLVLFIYVTRLASNEIFSPPNKIHREVGRAKDLSAFRGVYAYSFPSPTTLKYLGPGTLCSYV